MPLDPLFYKNAPKAAAPPAPFGAFFLTQGGRLPPFRRQALISATPAMNRRLITPAENTFGGDPNLPLARVLSRNCAEKFLGCAQQIFRALDNDGKLKFTNSGRHFLPSALIANLHALFMISSSSFDVHLFPSHSSAC